MTIWRFLKQEPSLSSMKPKVFISRMVRAQPMTVTVWPSSLSASAKTEAMVMRSICVPSIPDNLIPPLGSGDKACH